MNEKKPFLLKPAFKDYLWGGTKLRDEYGKKTDIIPLAESWECSTHPDGQSIVASGQFDGLELNTVLKMHPEYLGTHPLTVNELPILVKLIDARDNLSIQVHPDDEYAWTHEKRQLGKTEMWYILHADRGAKLVYGLKRNITRGELIDSLQKGTVEKYLRYISVKKNDVFLIEPGTIHAVGAGVIVAEIQENSNLTYRLYDYNRIEKNRKKRELHIDRALDVVRLECSSEPCQPMRVINYRNGYASELLGRCKYFQVERILLNTERYRTMADIKTGSNSFKVLLCIDGCGILFGADVMISFFKGDCIFIPAESIPLKLHGKAQLLSIGC